MKMPSLLKVLIFYFIILLISLVTPISDIFQYSSYINGEVVKGCKLSNFGLKSTCYDKIGSFEMVVVKYPFGVSYEYKFYNSSWESYSYHRPFLFVYFTDKDILSKKIPAADSFLRETKNQFK